MPMRRGLIRCPVKPLLVFQSDIERFGPIPRTTYKILDQWSMQSVFFLRVPGAGSIGVDRDNMIFDTVKWMTCELGLDLHNVH